MFRQPEVTGTERPPSPGVMVLPGRGDLGGVIAAGEGVRRAGLGGLQALLQAFPLAGELGPAGDLVRGEGRAAHGVGEVPRG